MQIQDDKVFCSVAAKWKNLIKGYAWTTRPHKTFNILQDQISKLHIHIPTDVFPFISPPLCYLAHSANSTSMWKPGNAKNNHCWNQHHVYFKYYIPTLGSAFTQQITKRKQTVIKHAIQSCLALLLHLVIMGDAQVTANWITCNTPRPSQRPSEPPTLEGRPT